MLECTQGASGWGLGICFDCPSDSAENCWSLRHNLKGLGLGWWSRGAEGPELTLLSLRWSGPREVGLCIESMALMQLGSPGGWKVGAGPALFAGLVLSPSTVPPLAVWSGPGLLPLVASWLFSSTVKRGQQTPAAWRSGAGPAALRLGRAELAWLRVVTGSGSCGRCGGRAGSQPACSWQEGKWEPPLPALPHPTRVSAGLFPGPLPGLASVCLSPSLSLGSCLCYFSFVFPAPDWFPKWYFGCPGHLEPPQRGKEPQS